ncbi:ArsA-related P-loop ATPase [Gordonia sp. (in: high G+C Gram-positive bacteria)]|uniref:ArsA-related P-loop ATPase n=1 Tax=Gordonia sp. (in: high G+C Gram-positive bacteria) TaxID=84139 RepID=UPI0016B71B7F|nr:ArsA-related P-loop ATPase [Gordonia sp. (in: high G+C Gram-positive bacteria)]NLG46496.1 ArsA family ATPase [Gordonia sp. (in: high G+C Gram-positive bacteria)]
MVSVDAVDKVIDVVNEVAKDGPGVWPAQARDAKLHFVSGKGGTGKTTVAAALALTLASRGKKVLLVECEERQAIAQLFDVPPLPPTDTQLVAMEGGGSVWALALQIEHALLEYLDMFYNLGFAGRAIKKVGAIDFVTTVAPGLKDVLVTGKIKERAIATDKAGARTYDVIVVDSPPTGRIGNFLDVTTAMRDLAKTGPIRNQSEGVAALLHSPDTVVHLCTLLEAMPVQETIESVAELRSKELHIGAIIINRVNPPYLPEEESDAIAEGRIDSARIEKSLADVGVRLADDDLAGLLTEAIDYASRLQAQQVARSELDEVDAAQVELPTVEEGVDLGALYELSAVLKKAGA